MLKRTIEFVNLPNKAGETWFVLFSMLFLFELLIIYCLISLYHAVLSDRQELVTEIIKNKGNVNLTNT